jgi:glycosyltransferase involved in cell wall biosynthesis
MKLSVFIIAQNEQERIPYTIKSIQDLATEIIVIDGGSTDDTVRICEELGATVISNQWPGYVAQKIFGEEQCDNKWILNLDADEEVSSALATEIKQLLHSEPQYKAYIIDIVMMHRKDSKLRRFAPYNSCIRLYHRDYASFANNLSGSLYKDTVRPNTGVIVGRLQGQILHRSITSIEQAVNKLNYYTSIQAQEMLAQNRKVSILRMIFEFYLSFFKIFFLRRYCVFGIDGFVDSMIYAFARFIRLAKANEKKK